MHRFLISLVIISFAFPFTTAAQQTKGATIIPSARYDYYIAISGIKEKTDVIAIENAVSNKPEIMYFMADRFPVRYFLLKSNVAVTQSQLTLWINNSAYKIEYFGLGAKAREEVILFNKKH